MKTSGVLHIPGFVIFLAVAIFAISPASAQLYFASQKTFSTKGVDKEVAFYKNAYDNIRSGNNGNNSFSQVFPETSFDISLPARNISFKTIDIKDSASTEVPNVNKEEIEFNFRTTSFEYPTNSKRDIGISEFSPRFLVVYAKALKEYAKKNDFDTSYVFLSNMGMLCNKKRFFVVNLATMEIEEAGLVSHGRGQGPTIYDKQYSNEPGSRSTSLGRYKIMGKYKGNYGEAYKMTGLDSTNRNASDRNIVLHSMNCIPDIENLMPACVSDGCPAVSAKFLSSLCRIIDTRKKPMLLWIFDSNLEEPVLEENHAVPLSTEFCATTTKPFPVPASHTNDQLHRIVNRTSHQNRFLLWLWTTKMKILKQLKKETSEPGPVWNGCFTQFLL